MVDSSKRNPFGCKGRPEKRELVKDMLEKRERPPIAVHKTYDLKKLKDQHREIARLLIAGHTNIQVSRLLGLTPVAIRLIRNSALFQSLMAELTKEADSEAVSFATRIKELKEISLDVIEETLDSDEIDQALKTKTAFDILNRKTDGYQKETRRPSVEVNLTKSFVSYDLSPLRSEKENPSDLKTVQNLDVQPEEKENPSTREKGSCLTN